MSPLFLLAAALLATCSLLPPEIHPAGRLVAHLLAALLALALGFSPRSETGGGSWRRVAWLLAPLACASLLLVDGGRARGLDEAAAITCFAVAFFAGRRIGTGTNQVASFGVVAALLGLVLSAQAIAQHHWAYPETAAALRAAQDPAADPFLVRLEAGRPSGPFSLPAALAGFLALSLPMTLFALRTARPGVWRAAWSAAILLQLYALVLTRSLGGLLAGTVACAFALAPAEGRSGQDDGRGRGRRLTRVAIAAGILFAAGAALFVYARRAEIGSHPGADPLSLRLGNWRAAVEMVRDHPILGVGPGRFPVFYPRFIAPGMNETQFAHNSYLQLAATWGAWTLAPLAFFVAAFCRPKRRRGAVAAAAGAGAGFLLHNAIDFTFFLPGIALPAALLLGVGSASGAARPAGAPSDHGRERRTWPARRFCGVVLAAVLLVYVATADRSAWHLERARALAQTGPSSEAEAEARKAAAACPWDPDPRAFLAQSLLARHVTTPEEGTLRRVTAERAARLEPESAILHHTVALDRAAAADPAAAWIEEERARRLYPGKALYRPETER